MESIPNNCNKSTDIKAQFQFCVEYQYLRNINSLSKTNRKTQRTKPLKFALQSQFPHIFSPFTRKSTLSHWKCQSKLNDFRWNLMKFYVICMQTVPNVTIAFYETEDEFDRWSFGASARHVTWLLNAFNADRCIVNATFKCMECVIWFAINQLNFTNCLSISISIVF